MDFLRIILLSPNFMSDLSRVTGGIRQGDTGPLSSELAPCLPSPNVSGECLPLDATRHFYELIYSKDL